MLRASLLGAFSATIDGAPARALQSHTARKLLLFLLLHRAAPVPRQRAAFALYPDTSARQAQTNLRHLLHRLRAAWPGVARYVDDTCGHLHWRPDAPCEIDLLAFEGALAPGAVDSAAEHYRGDLTPEFDDDWIVSARQHLRVRYLDALRRRAADLSDADPQAAIRLATRLIEAEPLDESAHRLLIALHGRAGEACASTLWRELGIRPSAETIDAQRDALARAAQAWIAHRVRHGGI